MRVFNKEQKTICALSTPKGLGGIGVIRVSGPQAVSLVKKLCPFLPQKVESHRVYFGSLYKDSQCLDEVLVTCFKKGKSYTGEETVEISCHGGPVVLSQVLKALLEIGIQLADKGEFTYRAFMNGRLDLVQAESVLSLIESRTEKEAQQALKHLKGKFSQKIEKIETKLTQVLAQIEASIDYSHEDIKTISSRQLKESLKELEQEITTLTMSYKTGESLKKGLNVVFAGPVNVGKSTLTNALLGKERSIVTNIPGTTRDFVEFSLETRGFKLNCFDTAGFRNTKNVIEKKGIEQTKILLKEADIVVFLFDLSKPFPQREIQVLKGEPFLIHFILGNKKDKKKWNIDRVQIPEAVKMEICALKKEGLKEFWQKLEAFVLDETNYNEESIVTTQLRHYQLLLKAKKGVKAAQKGLKKGLSSEFIVLDLQESLAAIYEILGKQFDDQIIEQVFKDFCLGK